MLNKKRKISKKAGDKGFVALTLVIVLSSLILAFTFIRGIEIGEFFDQVQLKGLRIMNYQNAYKCIDQAILNITNDYFYEISTSTPISYLHCAILMVKNENGLKIIEVMGNYKNILVKRRAVTRLHNNAVEIISIE